MESSLKHTVKTHMAKQITQDEFIYEKIIYVGVHMYIYVYTIIHIYVLYLYTQIPK